MGTFKQVSPQFTLYQTAPYQLKSHVVNPLCQETTDEVVGEEWSLACLQTTEPWLSPVTCRRSDTSSRTGVCERRPLSMTDFGESFTECEQAEPDFGELAMKLRESREDCTEGATGSVSISPSPPVRCLKQESSDYLGPKHPPVPPDVVECLDQQMTITQICSEQHIDKVSQRLYKVLYGYIVDQIDLDADTLKPVKPVEFYKKTIPATLELDLGAQGFYRTSKTKGDEQNLNSVTPSHASFMSHPDNANQALKDYSDTNYTKNLTPTTFVLMSHDSVVDALKENAGPHVQTSGLDYTIDIPLAPRVNEEAMLAHREVACRALTPESKVFEYKSQSPELTPEDHFYIASHNPSSSLEFVTPSESSRVVSCDSPTHLDLPCSLDTTIILTERRSSSPDSWSLYHELNFLTPDSPLPQIRPLSPLPPPIPQLDMGDVCAVPQGPAFISSAQASVLQAAETGERPLTPMVSNRRPFGRPISPRSEISSGGSISPQSLSFDIEDRASSPGSVVSETDSRLRSSEVGFDDRGSSLESVASLTAHSQLSPDPLIPHFGHRFLHSATLCRSTSSSPESLSSNMEPKGVHFMLIFSDDRPSSPESLASLNEHKPLFCEDVPSDNEFHLTKLESTSNEYRPGSPKLLTVGENQPPSQIEQLLVDDDWVLVSVCEAGEQPVSPQSKADCDSMSFSVAREIGALPTETALCCPQLSDSTLQVPHNDPLEPNAFTIKGASLPEHIGENTSLPLCLARDLSMSPHSSVPELEVEISLNVLKVCQSPSPKLGFWGTGSAQAVYQSHSSVEQSTEVSLQVETSFRKSVIKKQSGEPPTSDIEAKYSEARTQTLNTTPTEETEPHQFQPLDVSQSEKDEMSSSLFATNSEIQLLPSAVIAEFPQVQVKASESPAHRAQTEVEGAEYSLMYDVELWKLISQVHDPQYVGDTCNKIATFKYAPTCSDEAVTPHRVIEDRQASIEQKSEARPFLPDSLPELNPLPPCPIQLLTHMRGRSPESSANELRPLSPDLPIDRYRQSDIIALVTDYRSSPGSGISLACSDKEDHIKIPAIPPANRPSSPESTASVNEFKAPDSRIPEFGQTQPNYLMSINACRSSPESESSDTEQIPLDPDPISFEHVSSSQTEIQLPVYKLVYYPDIWKLNSKIHDPQYKGETLSKTGLFEYAGTKTEYIQVQAGVEKGDEAGLLFESKGGALERSSLPYSKSEHNSPHYTLRSIPTIKLDSQHYLGNQHTLSPIFTSSVHVAHPSQYRPNSPDVTSENKCETPWHLRYGPDPSIPPIVPESMGSSLESVLSSVDCGNEDLIFSKPGDREGLLMNAPTYKATQVPFYRLVYDAELWKLISQIRDPQYVGEMYMGKTGLFQYATSSSAELFTTNAEEEDLCKISSVHDRSVSTASIISEISERPRSAESALEYRAMSPEIEDLRASSAESIASLDKALSQDPPLPQYTHHIESAVFRVGSRPSSSVSVASDFELEVFETPFFSVRERSFSSDSIGFEDEYRVLTPDSPIPDFRHTILQQTASIAEERSPSPESLDSCMNNGVVPLTSLRYEVRPPSPESVISVNEYRDLCPDSPIPNFATNVFEPVSSFATSRSMSSKSVASDVEYGPMVYSALHSENRPESYVSVAVECEYSSSICQMCEFKNRPDSPESVFSVNEYRRLSPDSPLPHYTQSSTDKASVWYRSTSSEPIDPENDLETDICLTWLFEDRAVSPDSVAPSDEFTILSPDSPIPEFSQVLQESTMPHMYRSSSPQSLSSDQDMETESLFSLSFDERFSSPESVASVSKYRRLSPDSPVPEFRQSVPESYRDISCPRSLSPESVASDVEYSSSICQMCEFENRPDSPESVSSVNEYRRLSPDSPQPHYTQCSNDKARVWYRSTSSEPIDPENDLETDICPPWFFEDRPVSPDTSASGALSPDSPIPEFRQMLVDISSHVEYRSYSPQSLSSDWDMETDLHSTMLFDEDRPLSSESDAAFRYRLSPDSPLPEFSITISEPIPSIVGQRSTSPESTGSDLECGAVSLPLLCHEDRPSSPVSYVSGHVHIPLSPASPISAHVIRSFETVDKYRELRSISPESIVSDVEYNLSDCLMPGTWTENKPNSHKSITCTLFGNTTSLSEESNESHDKHMCLDSQSDTDRLIDKPTTPCVTEAAVLSTTMGAESLEEAAVREAQYTLVYNAELWKLISQVRDPQYTGDTFNSQTGFMKYIVSSTECAEDEQVKGKKSPHARVCTTNAAKAESNLFCSDPSQPLQYTFGKVASEALSDFDKLVVETTSEADCYDPPLLNESIPELIIGTPDVLVEEKIVSVSTATVNRLRPLSPHPTLPEFKKESPECVTLLRSNSSSQEITVAPDIDDSPLGLDRPVSPQSDTECRSLSVESAMHMVYERASSPDSMPEFNENRSLSPNSAIPAFPESLVEYPMTWATHGSSSLGSSDSECEVVVTSSRNPEVERSPASISSVHKFAPLLPDSPVPEFMRILSSYFKEMPHSYRSCSSISPVSLSSDSEFVALPIQCWIGDTPRPLTPQSVDSEEKIEFHCEGPNKLVSEAQLMTPVTSVAQPDQQPFQMSKMHTTSREAELDLRRSKNDCCKVTRSESVTVCVYEEWIQHGSEQPESVQIVQSNIHEQNMGNIHEEIQPQPSMDQDLLEMGEKVQHPSDGELKDTTQGSAMVRLRV